MDGDTSESTSGGPAAGARTWARRLALATLALGLAVYMGVWARPSTRSDTPTAWGAMGGRPVVQRLAPAGSSRGGQRLVELLRPSGLSTSELSNLVELMRPYADPDELLPGAVAVYDDPSAGAPSRITLRLDQDRTLRFGLSGARWIVRLDSVPVTRDTLVVAGSVSSSLYAATLSGEADRLSVAEKGDLVGHLSRVFAWQIDFYRDVRPGDAFRLALERDRRPDGSVRGSRVLAAEYMTSDTLLTAVRFRPGGDSRPSFYDEGGAALRGAFLKAPLDLVRVTSRFGGHRFHPMLGGYRTHRGIDYAAASGTPVRATGEGTVERAGWWGEYGLVIELQHGNGIRTRYAHLSVVEDGIRPGDRVVQGQTIGRVGSTGLSTAPHLHYEFLLRSIPTDPARVDLPVERPIPETDREAFARARSWSWLQLARVSWPGRPFIGAMGSGFGAGGHAGP